MQTYVLLHQNVGGEADHQVEDGGKEVEEGGLGRVRCNGNREDEQKRREYPADVVADHEGVREFRRKQRSWSVQTVLVDSIADVDGYNHGDGQPIEGKRIQICNHQHDQHNERDYLEDDAEQDARAKRSESMIGEVDGEFRVNFGIDFGMLCLMKLVTAWRSLIEQ